MKDKRFNLLFKILFALSILVFVPQQTEAQFLKKLAKKAKEKVDREAERRAQRRVDKKIDKTFHDAEDAIDGKKKNKGEKSSQKKKENKQASQQDNGTDQNDNGEKTTSVKWNKYDFVSGDTVIFEDGPSTNEENGEFPSRWDLYRGVAEIAEVDGAPVIIFPKRFSVIVPYLKNSNEDYLPEIFTIEFDCFFKKGEYSTSYYFFLYDKKNQTDTRAIAAIHVNRNDLDIMDYSGSTKEENVKDGDKESFWRHVSVAYTKGKLKVYLDNQRLINVPHFEFNPTGMSIQASGNDDTQSYFIKNVRIAKGGVKYYDRVLSEGKIIVNGIKFDINKATLKPESMGPINRIYKMMVKNPELNFSVEGHTDADGDDASNMTLSKARGKTVMDKLIEMGIDTSRLKYNGFGESKPIDNNSTDEGKANNRRVEFVKF